MCCWYAPFFVQSDMDNISDNRLTDELTRAGTFLKNTNSHILENARSGTFHFENVLQTEDLRI